MRAGTHSRITSPHLTLPSPWRPVAWAVLVLGALPSLAWSQAAPVASAPASAASSPAGGPPPFATVIKEAKRVEGWLPIYQKDEKIWLELKPEDLGKPFLLSPKLASGIGEGRLLGGLMIQPSVVEFRRVHNQVQLIERNMGYRAKEGTPAARAVAAAFSPSLLGSATVASQPHPERKSILVDVTGIFLSDILGISQNLQQSYRQGYNLDVRNSAVTQVRGKPEVDVIEVQTHFATNTIAVPQAGAAPGAPVPSTPRDVPDPRSLFVNLHYSLAKLPEQPMAPRVADARVGYFTEALSDFTDDLARTPRVRYVKRWRLEKKDPAAAVSEPVKPITYWVDRNVPVKYREAITAGILEWNKAFEAIGFKGAIVVKQQPDDATFDTLDADVASVRWMTNSEPSFGAIGPSHADPRTGEILDADIGFESLSSRNLRAARSSILSSPADLPTLLQLPGTTQAGPWQCEHAQSGAEQLAYALDLLEARGDLDPDSPEAEAFVQAYMKDVTMHEVGHTLGLRHNFRASTVRTDAQLSDPEFTQHNALTGSVMEYAPVNLARPGAKPVAPFQTTLGPYDYWAIEYAYKPIDPAQEATELQRIAARSAEPQLAFGTDEDNYLGVDPDSIQFDLGDDVLAFARKRFDIVRDLFQRQETRVLKPEADYAALRRSITYALRDLTRTVGALARQVGGVRTLRDHPGTGRDPLQPVPAAKQREALDLVAKQLLAADGLAVSPALQRKLAPDFQERGEAIGRVGLNVITDFAPAQAVLEVQRALLNYLMSDGVAAHLADSEAKALKKGDALGLAELYARLSRDVWSELGHAGDINASRRELQQDHVNRLSAVLLRPSSYSRADARSLARSEAVSLLSRIQTAAKRVGLSAEAKAHLAACSETLSTALLAKPVRAGA